MNRSLKYSLHLFTLCTGMALAIGLQGQATTTSTRDTSLSSRLDAVLDSAVSGQQIPGAVLLVRRGNSLLHFRAYGSAQLFDRNGEKLPQPLPMTAGHLFDIASLTKVVGTTTGILMLVDRGLLRTDDPVGKYIPAFATEEKKAITVRHLLTHTAGLYEWYPLYYRARNRQEVYRLIGELPLAFPVGKQRKYSDLGFTVLGQLIETISKQPLETFLGKEVFLPLGMRHTRYNPWKDRTIKNIAATSLGNPYEYRMVHDSTLGFRFNEIDPNAWNGWRRYNLVGEVNDGNAWYAGRGVSGAAGLFSTAEDLEMLCSFWLQKGKWKGRQLVKAATIDSFLTVDPFGNGLGWMMDPSNSFMKNAPAGSFGHTGFTGTSLTIVPLEKLVIVLLINRQQRGLINDKEYYNMNLLRRRVFELVMAAIGHSSFGKR